MKVIKQLLWLCSLAVLTGCQREVSIQGQVVLEGTAPPERQIVFDHTSAALQGTNTVTTRHYVTSTNGGLANVLVEIKGANNQRARKTEPVPLLIHRAQYEPYVIGVQTNQPIHLRNLDPLLHTAIVFPPAGSRNRARGVAIGSAAAGAPATRERLWARVLRRIRGKPAPLPAGVSELRFPVADTFVRLKCDTHPWKYGYIAVLDHPYFAVTDENGRFSLPPLPSGTYLIEARHLRAGTNSQRITIGPGHSSVFTIKFTAPKVQR
jgi:hypothetical protein